MSSPSCHVGDKTPVVCQSDDQFYLFNYAVNHGISVDLIHQTRPDEIVLITVWELGVISCPPFDGHLHRVCEALRRA